MTTNSVEKLRVYIDDRIIGKLDMPLASDETGVVVDLADRLSEHTLDELIWGGWPICPVHHTHPLVAMPGTGSRAWWQCPKDRTEVAAVGQLGLPPPA